MDIYTCGECGLSVEVHGKEREIGGRVPGTGTNRNGPGPLNLVN
jgi:hypothetical protein